MIKKSFYFDPGSYKGKASLSERGGDWRELSKIKANEAKNKDVSNPGLDIKRGIEETYRKDLTSGYASTNAPRSGSMKKLQTDKTQQKAKERFSVTYQGPSRGSYVPAYHETTRLPAENPSKINPLRLVGKDNGRKGRYSWVSPVDTTHSFEGRK